MYKGGQKAFNVKNFEKRRSPTTHILLAITINQHVWIKKFCLQERKFRRKVNDS